MEIILGTTVIIVYEIIQGLPADERHQVTQQNYYHRMYSAFICFSVS